MNSYNFHAPHKLQEYTWIYHCLCLQMTFIKKQRASKQVGNAINVVTESTEELSLVMAPLGLMQNTSKLVIQYHPTGDGSQFRRRTFAALRNTMPGEPALLARYLGRWFHIDSFAYPEVTKRKDAMCKSWQVLRVFCMSGANLQMRMLVFMAIVYNIGLSGMEIWTLRARHLRSLNAVVCHYGRKMMRGSACDRTSQSHFVSCMNMQVFNWLRLATFEIELSVRRLRWYQSICRFPLVNEQFITGLFFDLHGTVKATPTHPCIVQFADVLLALSAFDDFSLIAEVANRPLELITNEVYKQVFIEGDVSIMRRQFLATQIPLSKLVTNTSGTENIQRGDVEFPCHLSLPNGAPCNAVFYSKRALAQHVRRGRGIFNQIAQAVKTNMCPWCGTIFSSRLSAISHCKRSHKKRFCIPDKRKHVYSVQDLDNWNCPFCEYECTTRFYVR